MREITYDQIVSAVRSLCITANTVLPADLCQAIRTAREEEASPVGQAILGDLEENFTFAGARGLPICQDTGMAVVFVRLGQEVRITGGLLTAAIHEGVAKGYLEGNLRCSVVADPLRRENTGNNTPRHHPPADGGGRSAGADGGTQGVWKREHDRPEDVHALRHPGGYHLLPGGDGGAGGLQPLSPGGGGSGAGRYLRDGGAAGQTGRCCVRWTSAAAIPSTPEWRRRRWSASTPWALAPRDWEAAPPPCRWPSPPYPTPHRRAALRGESGLPCHPPRQPDAVMCV